jgi:hypothetical protein
MALLLPGGAQGFPFSFSWFNLPGWRNHPRMESHLFQERMTMRGIAGTLLFALLWSADINLTAATITAASCSASDVQAALNSAAAGDTINIPAGICGWTTGVSWTAPPNVTVRGAGNLSILGGGDATVIIDDYVGGAPLIRILTDGTGTFRLAGLTVRGGSGSIKESGAIAIGGFSKQMRVDHIHIDMQSYATQTAGKPMTLGGWLNGVVDHIIVDLAKQGHIQFSAALYGTGVDNYGDQSYAAPTGFGTSDFIFMEDSQFNAKEDRQDPTLYMGIVTDCNGGGRYVLRYNTIVSAGVQTHPTGGAVGGRGCRAHELYGNVALAAADLNPAADAPSFAFSWMSSGTSLVWGNTAVGAFKHFIYVVSMRKDNATYTQTPTPVGWGYCGTAFNGTGSQWDGNTDPASGYPCIDQPGRGQSDLLTLVSGNRVNSRTGTIAWPNQALEPVRDWLNTFQSVRGWGNDASNRFSVASGAETHLAENRDYYEFTALFDGTAGVGVGTRASRPANCTAGVAYWSTDQGGNWNATNATANDGTLDVCSAANTWTNAVYTPFVYPHPLQSGTTAPQATTPGQPRNLRIIG